MFGIRKQCQRAWTSFAIFFPVEKQKLVITGLCFLILSAFFSFFSFAHAENYIGKKITEIEKHTAVQWLSRDELVALISDKMIVGESAKTKSFHLYFKKDMAGNGTFTLKIFNNNNDKLLKKITDNTWLVQPDGTWCTTRGNVRRCNKKVCKIDDIYVSVLKKNGKINSAWSVKESPAD